MKAFFDAGKPVAAICHGPWTHHRGGRRRGPADDVLAVAARPTSERRGEWVDQEAVVDGNLVTSRKPDDIPAFNQAMIGLFATGRAPGGPARVLRPRRKARPRPPRLPDIGGGRLVLSRPEQALGAVLVLRPCSSTCS